LCGLQYKRVPLNGAPIKSKSYFLSSVGLGGKGRVRGWLVRVREREKAKIRGEGKE
jgi:hypothetical protein